MKRSRRTLLFVLLGGTGLAVLAAVLALRVLVDVDRHRALIEQRARQALGRDVRLGDLGLSFFPLGLRIEELEVGARADGGGGELLVARSVRIGARLLPLLQKRLEVTSIVVGAPSVRIERGTDGRWNFESPEAEGKSEGTGEPAGLDFVVRDLRVSDASVTLIDAGPGRERPLELNVSGLDFVVRELRGPRLEIAGLEVSDASVRVPNPGGPGPPLDLSVGDVRLSLDRLPTASAATVELTGTLAAGGSEGRLSLGGRIGPVAGNGGSLPAQLSVRVEPVPLILVERALGQAFDLERGKAQLAGDVTGTLPERVEARGSIELSEGRVLTQGPDAQPLPLELALRYELAVTPEEQRLAIHDLRGSIGASDIAGRLTVLGFTDPRARFELVSRRADLGELFSILGSPEAGGSVAGSPARARSAGPRYDGSLRIESGSLRALDFSALQAVVAWVGDDIVLEPVQFGLYGGTFDGRIASRLGGIAPELDVRGSARELDVGAFLADNLGAGELLTGRLSGKVDTRGSGLDYETLVRSLAGSGAIEVHDGKLGRLDVLSTVAKVSGVFGEKTLEALAGRLAAEGTAFRSLRADLSAGGARMSFDPLRLESPAFQLVGAGAVDLVSSELEGRFELILAQDVSALMRGENSRAAEVFWNSRTQQVELPFSLSGPFSSPTPRIELGAAARETLRDRAREELRDLVGRKLGAGGRSEEPAPAAPEAAPPAPETAAQAGLGVEIGTRWTGPVLARDLRIEGSVRGEKIRSATLEVTDARGTRVRPPQPLEEIERHVASGAASGPAAIAWSVKIDGKKLLLAKFPLKVTVVVTGADGTVAESREVER